MKRTVVWRKVKKEHRDLADARTRDLVNFYGQFISTLTIHDLASSCYMQGIEDVVKAEKQTAELVDYQI